MQRYIRFRYCPQRPRGPYDDLRGDSCLYVYLAFPFHFLHLLIYLFFEIDVAPELMAAKFGTQLVYDEKVDVFAFGAVVYSLVFDRAAFIGSK